jgi:hypothetical protein
MLIIISILFLIMVSSSSLRNVRLSTVITAAGAGVVVVVVVLLLLSNINVNNNTLLQSKLVFAQLEEEGVVAEAEENATATTTTSGAATNETAAAAASGDAAAAAASPARNNNMTGVEFLFIQSAQSGSVSEVNATTFTLELRDVSDKTIMFSDRPDRIVSSVNTTNFIGNWSTGPNSFAADPPNAVLILDDEEQREELAVIELFNPEYDSAANTLRYDITAENATATTAATTTTTTSIDLPSEFGQSTLVIDAENQQGPYVPGKQPDVTGGVTKPDFPE